MRDTKITFPKFTGVRCLMMPFIQGDSKSLPEQYQPYAQIIESNYLEKGEVGYLTIDETYVKGGQSQRGYGRGERNVHIEVGQCLEGNRWGSGGSGGYWGGRANVLVDSKTDVLISNSIDNTCMLWDVEERSYTKDGDLSHLIDKYPENTGVMLKAGELAKIGIFTPHECIKQSKSGNRQFLRIVGKGVTGREDHFTVNPLIFNL